MLLKLDKFNLKRLLFPQIKYVCNILSFLQLSVFPQKITNQKRHYCPSQSDKVDMVQYFFLKGAQKVSFTIFNFESHLV